MADRVPFKVCRVALAAAWAAVALAGCAGYLGPPVSAELKQQTRASWGQLQRGYELHEAKCAKCHAFESPAGYSEDELEFDVMPVMADKAKLGPEDEKAVLEYLLAARRLGQVQAQAATNR